jgi:hypothetical protein
MTNTTLAAYVAERLKSGAKADDIKQHLLLVGWSEEEAGEALVRGLIDSGTPAPERIQGTGRLASTVEVVLSAFSFILLGGVASALIVLYYQIINHYHPDALVGGYGYSDVSTSAIHYATAALIVGFPLYFASLKMWFKRYRDDEAKEESKLTKWITYIVLLVAAVTIVGDLITAIFYFLQGELSVRFVLKALTILVVFGLVFGFYYFERKKIQYKQDVPRRTFYLFGYAVGALAFIGIVVGFFASGSPATERMRGLDTTRAQDLSSLASCLQSYGYDKKMLPPSLDALIENSQYAYCSGKTDPETGAPYEYRILAASEKVGAVTQGRFELCANFSLEATKDTIARDPYGAINDKWSLHPAGRSCDTETVTLDRDEKTVMVPASPAAAPIR